VGFAFPAVWMIKLATRKYWVVVVHGPEGRRHLIFRILEVGKRWKRS